jgi:hypothetical protein
MYMIKRQAESPPRLSRKSTDSQLASAFQPFKQYIEYLAHGKLDGYLDSINRDDKISVPEMVISKDPNLLLHGLGKEPDLISGLFIERPCR